MNAPARPPFPLMLPLALLALLLAGWWMTDISRTDPWYRNTDMNLQNLDDSLAINASLAPRMIDQPGLVPKYLLALDGRTRHALGALPVWNMETFGAGADPLAAIPPLIRAGRVHQRMLVLLFILSAAGLAYAVTRDSGAAGLAAILLCGSPGLLFHGLLTRPELHCVWFGNVLALWCAWRATGARTWFRQHVWLFVAGLMVGLATLSKLPGICYLGLCYAWCWLAAVRRETPAEAAPAHWAGLLPAAGGLLTLGLLVVLAKFSTVIGPVALLRLRVAAVVIGVLPLLLAGNGPGRWGRFLLARAREFVLLAGGALAALPLGYLALRGVMTEPAAAEYLARVLHYLADPAPTITVLIDTPQVATVFLEYVRQDWPLFLGTGALAAGACLVRSVPGRLKAFIALLLLGGLGMILVMSKRHFTVHYGIFFQAPLLLAAALGWHGLAGWWRDRSPGSPPARWMLPGAAVLALLGLLATLPRTRTLYTNYQKDAERPVSELTVTFFFDHDSHTAEYLRIMRARYGDRAEFRRNLDRLLAEPANHR